MKSFYHPLVTISAISVMLCSLAAPAIASQRWRGGGQIVSGSGSGGNVTLALIKDNDTVTFQSGPDQGKSVSLNSNSAQTSSGTWQIAICGDYSDKLCVTFRQNQPRRVIRYLLTKS